jgi:hypothetical protein
MRTMGSMALGLVMLFVLALGVRADDKEVTLKGTITCAKCDLKVAKSCATVIKVEEDGKDAVVYYFDKVSGKENHKKICTEAKKGSVTGTVSEKDGKKWITVTKVEFEG